MIPRLVFSDNPALLSLFPCKHELERSSTMRGKKIWNKRILGKHPTPMRHNGLNTAERLQSGLVCAVRQTAGRHLDVTGPLNRGEDTEAPASDQRTPQLM